MRAPRDQQTDQPRRWDRQKKPRSSVGDWACQCTKVHALWGRQKTHASLAIALRRGDPWRAAVLTVAQSRPAEPIHDLWVFGSFQH